MYWAIGIMNFAAAGQSAVAQVQGHCAEHKNEFVFFETCATQEHPFHQVQIEGHDAHVA